MRVDILRVALGGFLGTVVLTVSLSALAPYFTGAPTDVARQLAQRLAVSRDIGLLVHFVNGTVLFPAIYAYLLYPLLPGPPSARGLVWGLFLWVPAEVVLVPGGDDLASAVSFVAHAAYGVILGRVAGPPLPALREESRSAGRRTAADRPPGGSVSHRRS